MLTHVPREHSLQGPFFLRLVWVVLVVKCVNQLCHLRLTRLIPVFTCVECLVLLDLDQRSRYISIAHSKDLSYLTTFIFFITELDQKDRHLAMVKCGRNESGPPNKRMREISQLVRVTFKSPMACTSSADMFWTNSARGGEGTVSCSCLSPCAG